jgi:osmotically-inducible protein OsmY
MSVADTAETRLRKNSFLALRNISCEFANGVLTLDGCLPSYYLKQVAQEIVSGVLGVAQVVNLIEVASTRRSDRETGQFVSWPKPR